MQSYERKDRWIIGIYIWNDKWKGQLIKLISNEWKQSWWIELISLKFHSD